MDIPWQGRVIAAAAGTAALLSAREAIARRREADLTDQVIVITGASRGLGRALAEAFTREGCALAICARDADVLEQTAQHLTNHGAIVFARPCDVTNQDQVNQFISEVLDHYGRIDILVNNAGMMTVGPIGASTTDDMRQMVDTNLYGMYYPTLAVCSGMRDRGEGRIVNVSSIGGRIPTPHLVSYCAAKFAATGFSLGLAAELLPEGITVTTISPGPLRTGSYLAGHFRGDPTAEFAWAARGQNLPWVMSAERAARIIVKATKRGELERTFPWTTNVFVRLVGLMPATTARVLSVMKRALPADPRTGEDRVMMTGREIAEKLGTHPKDLIEKAGQLAARDYQDRPDPRDTTAVHETITPDGEMADTLDPAGAEGPI